MIYAAIMLALTAVGVAYCILYEFRHGQSYYQIARRERVATRKAINEITRIYDQAREMIREVSQRRP
jgi:hypothetical protein